MEKYVAQPRIPEHALYGKAKETVEKKVSTGLLCRLDEDYKSMKDLSKTVGVFA